MKLHGLQKMTLLDFPGHVACTVFLGGCSFRCPFCHNFELVDGSAQPLMEDTELFSFLEKRTGLLDGVAITGGEPCLHAGLPHLMRRIHDAGFAVKLDTNGYHPEMLERILKEGLADYVAMDIKNSPEKYAQTAGLKLLDFSRIQESIRLLKGSRTDFEFRTTVVRELHTASDFEKIGELITGAKRYFLQSFTDRETVPFGDLHAADQKTLEQYLKVARRYVPLAELRGVG